MSSIPESMTPTRTGACAIGTAAASDALMACAPQLETASSALASAASSSRTDSVPPPAGEVSGSPPCPSLSAGSAWTSGLVAWAGFVCGAGAGLSASGAGAGGSTRSESGTGATRVGPMEWTPTPALDSAAARSGANEAEELWAKNVPISG